MMTRTSSSRRVLATLLRVGRNSLIAGPVQLLTPNALRRDREVPTPPLGLLLPRLPDRPPSLRFQIVSGPQAADIQAWRLA